MEAVTAEGKMFVYARKKLKMSQRRMAMKLGINQSSISKIESGIHRPRVRTIRKLELMMRQPAEHLACAALGKPVPAAKPQKPVTPARTEAKVVKLNPMYRKMDNADLQYLRIKFMVDAEDLGLKARRMTQKLEGRTLKQKLHRLTLEDLEKSHKSAHDLHTYLISTKAPENFLRQTKTEVDKAAKQLTKEQNYGIFLPTVVELARKQMDIEVMQNKVAYLKREAKQIEGILHSRKQNKATFKGKVIMMPGSTWQSRAIL